jgi:recombination protein U
MAVTKYNPRTNAEGYADPTPYEAERHMRAQITGKQARAAGNYFENMISASCDYSSAAASPRSKRRRSP